MRLFIVVLLGFPHRRNDSRPHIKNVSNTRQKTVSVSMLQFQIYVTSTSDGNNTTILIGRSLLAADDHPSTSHSIFSDKCESNPRRNNRQHI